MATFTLKGDDGKDYRVDIPGAVEIVNGPTGTICILKASKTEGPVTELFANVTPGGVKGDVVFSQAGFAFTRVPVLPNGITNVVVPTFASAGDYHFTAEFLPADAAEYASSTSDTFTFTYIPTPVPVAPVFPEGANTVTIAGKSYPLAAVDPTPDRNIFPGARGKDELVIYTKGLLTNTNSFGREWAVDKDGKLTGGWRVNQTPIQPNCYVLSGHEKAGDFLVTNGSTGGVVKVTKETIVVVEPGPTNRVANQAVWGMMFSNSPKVNFGDLPLEIDELRFAFLINAGVKCGPSPWGLVELKRQFQTFLNRRSGRLITASIGGGNMPISIPSAAAYVTAMKQQEQELGITWGGMNVDWENAAFKSNASKIGDIMRIFKKERGPSFFCSWSPNGTYKWDYRDYCQANPDVVDDLSFQNYDTTVTYDTAKSILEAFRGPVDNPKLPVDKLGISMMIADGASDRWTLAQCVANATRLRAELGVRKTSNWEASRQQLQPWAVAMRRIMS